MDGIYEGNETRALARAFGYEVERLFRRLKGYRHVLTRLNKLDVMTTAFIFLALILDTRRWC